MEEGWRGLWDITNGIVINDALSFGACGCCSGGHGGVRTKDAA